jgi:general secretion pathway protein K
MTAPCRRRSAVLILVLWAITVLALLAGGLSFVIRQDLAIANIQRDRIVAHWAARAGVEQAIAEAMDDTDGIDTDSDYWFDDPTIFEAIELTTGRFTVRHDDYAPIPAELFGVADEAARLNINVATRDQLMQLPDMTGPIASAIIDWRDADEQPLEDGLERGHYASLSHPYDIRNGPFRSTRELLLVRGVTPDLFYGEDLNNNGLLDANENDGSRSQPPDNADGRLDRGWAAYITVYSYEKNVDSTGNKRLNINSAGDGELSMQLMLESWAAQSIVRARNERRFEHLSDLLNVRRASDIPRNANEIDYYSRGADEKDHAVTVNILRQIIDRITLTDDDTLQGRINVNTAPRAVLQTLPGVTADTADAIIRQRDAVAGFSSIADLFDVAGIDQDVFERLEQHVTVRSGVLRIYSYGQSDSGLARASIECVVDRNQDRPRMLYWLESAP